MEDVAVFQCLRETGILTLELRVLRELSSKCRDLYDTYVIPKIPDGIIPATTYLGYCTLIHLIGKEPPRSGAQLVILHLIHGTSWIYPSRMNPYIREIVPFSDIQEDLSETNDIHIDPLVALYGVESMTLDILNGSLRFDDPRKIPEYVPHVAQIGLGCSKLLRRVLAYMLVVYMKISDRSYAEVIMDWTDQTLVPGDYLGALQERIYWKAVTKRLRISLNTYGEIAGLDRKDISMLFGNLPPGWNLPQKLWKGYGWFVLIMNQECRGYLLGNLRHNRQYSKFTCVAQTISLAKDVYKLIPQGCRSYFRRVRRYYGGGGSDFDGDELNLLGPYD